MGASDADLLLFRRDPYVLHSPLSHQLGLQAQKSSKRSVSLFNIGPRTPACPFGRMATLFRECGSSKATDATVKWARTCTTLYRASPSAEVAMRYVQLSEIRELRGRNLVQYNHARNRAYSRYGSGKVSVKSQRLLETKSYRSLSRDVPLR